MRNLRKVRGDDQEKFADVCGQRNFSKISLPLVNLFILIVIFSDEINKVNITIRYTTSISLY